MTVAWFSPASLSLAAMLWLTMLSPSAPMRPDGGLQHPSLAGDLLIASPHIGDPRFWHTVILIVAEDDGGTLGIVINRPVGRMPLGGLLDAMGLNGAGIKGAITVFAGGPVAPSIGFVVHSTDYHDPGTINIDGGVAVTENPHILIDIGHGHGPRKTLVAFGYAGWAPGQLAMELARGDWFTMPETTKLVFDDKRADVWTDAMASRSTPL